MDVTKIDAKGFVDEARPVVECAELVAEEVSRLLRTGACVVLSVRGVRGVSSSFFNVVLSAVAEALGSDFGGGRFDVETETKTQRMIYQRSLQAFSGAKP